MGQTAVKMNEPIRRRLPEVEVVNVRRHRPILIARRVRAHRQQTAAAAVQEKHRRARRVHVAAARQRQPLIAIAVKVDLHVRREHARQPPLGAGKSQAGNDEGIDGLFDDATGRGSARVPERRLVRGAKPAASQALHCVQQPLEQRRGKRSIDQRDQRTADNPSARTVPSERAGLPISISDETVGATSIARTVAG